MIVPSFLAVFVLRVVASGPDSLYNFLFGARKFPSSVSRSVKVAEKEVDRISGLLKEVSGLALFLPTDSAWEARPGALEAILNEAEGNTRYDTLLAVSAEVPLSHASSWASLKSFAETQNGGVIDSAYGTPYFLMDSNRVCIGEWSNGNYVEGECASVVGDPIVLSDAVVYQIDRLLIPSELEDAIESLKAGV